MSIGYKFLACRKFDFTLLKYVRIKNFHLLLKEIQSNPKIVHDVAGLSNKFSWKEKQVTNILSSSDEKLRKQGTRGVRKNYPKDKAMLNKLSVILTEESLSSNIDKYEDFYAWCARLLGSSGHKEYLPVLEKVVNSTHKCKRWVNA